MTDIPKGVTSTSLPLCPLFTCKSNWSGARTHPNILMLSYCWLYLRVSLMQLHQTHHWQAPWLLVTIQIKLLNFLPPVGVGHPPHGCRALPFRIKGHGPVDAQHEPHVRDTQMNMCQRHGNESRAWGAWKHAILIRAEIKPCQAKEVIPQLTYTHHWQTQMGFWQLNYIQLNIPPHLITCRLSNMKWDKNM